MGARQRARSFLRKVSADGWNFCLHQVSDLENCWIGRLIDVKQYPLYAIYFVVIYEGGKVKVRL